MLIAGTAITEAFDFAWGRFTERIAGLTDDEFRWDPAPGVPNIAWRVEHLAATYGAWRRPLAQLDDNALGQPLGSDWGPYAESTVFDLALHVLDEVVHHAAEVALLRDLYPARH